MVDTALNITINCEADVLVFLFVLCIFKMTLNILAKVRE